MARIWSKDPSSQVAAIAVGDTPNQVAWGYNGFPPGIADTHERLTDRDTKYRLTRHAEPNALSNAWFPVRTLYVTHHLRRLRDRHPRGPYREACSVRVQRDL